MMYKKLAALYIYLISLVLSATAFANIFISLQQSSIMQVQLHPNETKTFHFFNIQPTLTVCDIISSLDINAPMNALAITSDEFLTTVKGNHIEINARESNYVHAIQQVRVNIKNNSNTHQDLFLICSVQGNEIIKPDTTIVGNAVNKILEICKAMKSLFKSKTPEKPTREECESATRAIDILKTQLTSVEHTLHQILDDEDDIEKTFKMAKRKLRDYENILEEWEETLPSLQQQNHSLLNGFSTNSILPVHSIASSTSTTVQSISVNSAPPAPPLPPPRDIDYSNDTVDMLEKRIVYLTANIPLTNKSDLQRMAVRAEQLGAVTLQAKIDELLKLISAPPPSVETKPKSNANTMGDVFSRISQGNFKLRTSTAPRPTSRKELSVKPPMGTEQKAATYPQQVTPSIGMIQRTASSPSQLVSSSSGTPPDERKAPGMQTAVRKLPPTPPKKEHIDANSRSSSPVLPSTSPADKKPVLARVSSFGPTPSPRDLKGEKAERPTLVKTGSLRGVKALQNTLAAAGGFGMLTAPPPKEVKPHPVASTNGTSHSPEKGNASTLVKKESSHAVLSTNSLPTPIDVEDPLKVEISTANDSLILGTIRRIEGVIKPTPSHVEVLKRVKQRAAELNKKALIEEAEGAILKVEARISRKSVASLLDTHNEK